MMNKSNKYAITIPLLLIVAIIAGCGSSQPVMQPKDKHFLWKVQNGGSTVYLAGSIHMLKAGLYPLPDVFENTFASADKLVLELNLDSLDMTSVTKMLLAKGLSSGKTLKEVLPDSVYALAAKKLKSYNYDISAMHAFRPWFVMFTISALEMQKEGFEAKHGLDMHFYNEAVKTGKKIEGLETLEDQVRVFEDISDSAQTAVLYQALIESEPTQKQMDDILTAWKHGDTASVAEFMMRALQENPEAMNALLVNRNRRWLPEVEAFLHTGKITFVVVGAAHLAGPYGLLRLLEKNGYTVTQL